jgi:amidase
MVNIEEITILQLQEMYQKNTISTKELVQEYLNKIALIDQGPQKLNSVLEINPDALAIAEELDTNRARYNSNIFGVPILLKDNIDTADRMHTSAGSLALADSIASKDAEIVAKLRQKGVLFLGKTNMTEFANHMTNGMKAGYSSRGGEVKSPYRQDKSPSGSSTGSAVAVTTNLCTVAFGTDTSGSIITPAFKNGIVGYRPSPGILSKNGIIPVSFTLDSVGPMSRTVMDSCILFSELTDSKLITETTVTDIVIGIDQVSLYSAATEEGKKIETLIKALKKAGAKIKYIKLPQIPSTNVSNISFYEFKYSINRYLEGLPSNYKIRSLKDIIAYNDEHPKETLRFGQTLLKQTEETTQGDLSEANYKLLMRDRDITRSMVLDQLQECNVCILFQTNLVLQYVGLPIIAIPHGRYNDGMPFGIRLTAKSDASLLSSALSIEQIFGYRVPPHQFVN